MREQGRRLVRKGIKQEDGEDGHEGWRKQSCQTRWDGVCACNIVCARHLDAHCQCLLSSMPGSNQPMGVSLSPHQPHAHTTLMLPSMRPSIIIL